MENKEREDYREAIRSAWLSLNYGDKRASFKVLCSIMDQYSFSPHKEQDNAPPPPAIEGKEEDGISGEKWLEQHYAKNPNWDQEKAKRDEALKFRFTDEQVAGHISEINAPLPAPTPPAGAEGEGEKMNDQLAAEADMAAIEYGKEWGSDQYSENYHTGAGLTEAVEYGQSWMWRKMQEEINKAQVIKESHGRVIVKLMNEVDAAKTQIAELQKELAEEKSFHAALESVVREMTAERNELQAQVREQADWIHSHM